MGKQKLEDVWYLLRYFGARITEERGYLDAVQKQGIESEIRRSRDRIGALESQVSSLERQIKKAEEPGALVLKNSRCSWPRLWSLLQYFLPKKARLRLFAPAIEDLKADYFESFKEFKGFCPRLFLRFAFALRTTVLVISCWRAMGIDKVITFVGTLVPDRVKRWWRA